MIVIPVDQIIDKKWVVIAAVGAPLLRVHQGNLQPFLNTEIDDLRADRLLRFIPSCSHKLLIVEFDQPRPE